MMKTGELPFGSEFKRRKMVPVKIEIKGSLEEQHDGHLIKRSMPFSYPHTPGTDTGIPEPPLLEYNLLDEPSPLGLRLRKSPSLLDLIEMKLSQASAPKAAAHSKEHKGTASVGTDKLKASNFPASVLRIGTWEYKSRYEGDLVAKCYFAKHKLVWEVLDGGLKNKMEIQWSDIMALKANYPDDGPQTLDVVLARQPLFFRETNPQPRKHTLWQATSDFTGGQASIHRRHFLQCSEGLLGKHFEKLIQCDPRLYFLSEQAEITLVAPYFETKVSAFDDTNETSNGFDLNTEQRATFLDLRDAVSPPCALSSSPKNEQDSLDRPTDHFLREAPSPRSAIGTLAIEETSGNGVEELKIKVPGLHHSMSMSDLVNHIEHRISEYKRSSENPNLSSEEQQSLEILEEISRCLFSESQHMPASDEKSLMSRVNSLCCLLQKDPVAVQNLPSRSENCSSVTMVDKGTAERNSLPSSSVLEGKITQASSMLEGEPNADDPDYKQTAPAMSRKDSVGELLLSLPRIASLPQFFFNIAEDYDNRAR